MAITKTRFKWDSQNDLVLSVSFCAQQHAVKSSQSISGQKLQVFAPGSIGEYAVSVHD